MESGKVHLATFRGFTLIVGQVSTGWTANLRKETGENVLPIDQKPESYDEAVLAACARASVNVNGRYVTHEEIKAHLKDSWMEKAV